MRAARGLLPLLLPAAFLAGGCGDSYQVAARVGEVEITHAEVAEEAEAWVANDQLVSQLGVSPDTRPGSVPQAVVTEVLNLDIQAELARIALGELAQGSEIEQLRAQVEQQFGDLFAAFPEDVRAETVDDVAVLQLANANGASLPDVEVYVSPRYGEIDATGAVIVPEGARPATGSASPAAPPAP